MSQADRATGQDGFIFLGAATFITLLRTYSRWELVGIRSFQADDYLVWFALICYAGDTVNNWKLVTQFPNLGNNDMTPKERAALDPNGEEYHLRVISSKLHLVEWFIYMFLLWTLKLAVLFNLRRLLERVDGSRKKILAGFWFLGITFAVVLVIPFVMCVPITKLWQINPDPGPRCYAETSPAILWTCLACNVLTDIYLTLLPMPMLFKTTLPRIMKFALVVLFGCGILVAIAAILRATLVVTTTGDFHTLAFLPFRETFIAILTTNLPSIFVLLKRWLSPFFGFLRTQKSKASTGKTKTRAALSTFRHDPRRDSDPGERRATFIDQMFSKPHGTKTEIYSMKKIDTFPASEVTGSEVYIIQTTSGGQNSDERGGSLDPSRISTSLSQCRPERANSVPKRTGSRGWSQRRPTAASRHVEDSEKQTEGGITKKVEITISEERSDQRAAYMAQASPTSDIDLEAAAGRSPRSNRAAI